MRCSCPKRSSFAPRAGLALAFVLAAQTSPAWSRTWAEQVVADVREDIGNGECKAAASQLNEGLAKHYPEVQLLAGSMYENGACLKVNWDRAVYFYTQAYKSGQTVAAFRLAAGFAAPKNGPNLVSALWWASRLNLIGGACLPSEPSRNDSDLFLKEWKTWPDSRAAACNYVAGVMSTIAAEVRYPTQASRWSVGGDVVITFKPGVPRVTLTLNGTEQYQLSGIYDGDRLWEQNNKGIGSAFVQSVRAVADRALKRYPKPDGISADFPDAKLTMHFEMDDL